MLNSSIKTCERKNFLSYSSHNTTLTRFGIYGTFNHNYSPPPGGGGDRLQQLIEVLAAFQKGGVV